MVLMSRLKLINILNKKKVNIDANKLIIIIFHLSKRDLIDKKFLKIKYKNRIIAIILKTIALSVQKVTELETKVEIRVVISIFFFIKKKNLFNLYKYKLLKSKKNMIVNDNINNLLLNTLYL